MPGTLPGMGLGHYQRAGFVVLVSAESQEAAQISIDALGDAPVAPVLLDAVGEPRWLGSDEIQALRAELLSLNPQSVQAALSLVDQALADGTGVALLPPLSQN
jgi:hypothetical protein